MNLSFLSRVKARIEPGPRDRGGAPPLTAEEHATLYALFVALTDDAACGPDDVCRHIEARCASTAGYLDEYRAGAALLEQVTAKVHPGRAFCLLSDAERDGVLARILRRYAHPLRQPQWRQRLNLTSENLDMLFAGKAARRLRLYVVRDLLGHYYTTAAGWGVVGYESFPGRSRVEREPCEVRAVRAEDDGVSLWLSDGTVEVLAPSALRTEEDGALSVVVKGGRQRARFSRLASLSLADHLTQTPGGVAIAVGGKIYEVQT